MTAAAFDPKAAVPYGGFQAPWVLGANLTAFIHADPGTNYARSSL